jgi:hypothetical protein
VTPPRQAPEGLNSLRAARREAVKRHHPDVGGSSDALREALHRVELEHRAVRHDTPSPQPVHPEIPADSPTAVRSNGVLRTAIRQLQRHLPRRVPGSRRYIRL